jgi:hypothetical protein
MIYHRVQNGPKKRVKIGNFSQKSRRAVGGIAKR